MELVEGETLQARIKRGPIPADEALTIAKQIAEALEAAHEKGIVHRDLKPGNVMLTIDGKAKVLDFGLAKAYDVNSANVDLSNSPTMMSMAATNAGIILGTAAYMSPEQAKGRPVDRRTDIFALGCILYEMLTGKHAFEGDDVTDILGAVLRIEPDWSQLPDGLTPGVRNLVRLCLEKNAKNRRSDAADVRLDIEQALKEPASAAPTPIESVKRPLWKRAIPIVVTAVIAGLIATFALWNLQQSPSAAITRFPLLLHQDQVFSRTGRPILAISPDGLKVVYVANNQLFLRQMAEMEARPIPGADGDVADPFFSPDGQSIGFWSARDSAIMKIAISGGAPFTICKADIPFGASWDDDHIVFAASGKGIMRVSANGGEPEVLVPGNASELTHGPQILDHGKAVLFTVTTVQNQSDRCGPGADCRATPSLRAAKSTCSERQRRSLRSDRTHHLRAFRKRSGTPV